MTVTDKDVQELIAEMDRGRANWINGLAEALNGVEQAPDMYILAPFGGLGPSKGSMTPEQLAAGQAAFSVQVSWGRGTLRSPCDDSRARRGCSRDD